MYWTYILQNPAGHFYIGQTDDLEGFLIADNQDGPFQLEAAWIKATTLAERQAQCRVEVEIGPPLLYFGEPRLEIERKGVCGPVR